MKPTKADRKAAEEIISKHVGEAHNYAAEQGTSALYEESGFDEVINGITDETAVIIAEAMAPEREERKKERDWEMAGLQQAYQRAVGQKAKLRRQLETIAIAKHALEVLGKQLKTERERARREREVLVSGIREAIDCIGSVMAQYPGNVAHAVGILETTVSRVTDPCPEYGNTEVEDK